MASAGIREAESNLLRITPGKKVRKPHSPPLTRPLKLVLANRIIREALERFEAEYFNFGETMVQKVQFDRDAMARWYAKQHLKIDDAIQEIYFLPENADEREIRFVEVNKLLPDRLVDQLEPIDFGVDYGSDNQHQLMILDVTKNQWKLIKKNQLPLPGNWSTTNMMSFKRRKKS